MLKRVMLMLCISVLLQACTPTRVSYQIEAGKQSFIAGNYEKAFKQLLPAASQGDAHAEYAVGYMYYYGYGTTRDSQSGLFWMQKSADQKYAPAQKALELIRTQKDTHNANFY